MAQGYSLHPDGTLAEHTVTNTRAYTEINGLDDGRIMFAIVSFEGVLNFTAEGRLYYRIGAHLLDVDGTLPRSISTPYRDRLSGGRLRRLDTVDEAARDCYTWHRDLQHCMWLDYICNCFLIVMRPVVPSDAHAGTRAFQTNGPRRRECTVANNGQQRPPFEHARHETGPVH
jgi:hypothetical protein